MYSGHVYCEVNGFQTAVSSVLDGNIPYFFNI